MSRYIITVKTFDRDAKRYKIDQKFKLKDYNKAMNLLDKLADQYYRESMELYTIDFKDNMLFAR